jgi:hypothetical protein
VTVALLYQWLGPAAYVPLGLAFVLAPVNWKITKTFGEVTNVKSVLLLRVLRVVAALLALL